MLRCRPLFFGVQLRLKLTADAGVAIGGELGSAGGEVDVGDGASQHIHSIKQGDIASHGDATDGTAVLGEVGINSFASDVATIGEGDLDVAECGDGVLGAGVGDAVFGGDGFIAVGDVYLATRQP